MDLTPLQRKAAATALAVALAAPAEGLRRIAYYDPPGILTVCRGHTGSDIDLAKEYSLAECDAFMNKDMKKAVDQVDRCVPGLPQKVLAAFADAAYNLGPTVACDTSQSTSARLLKAGNIKGACQQLPRWNNAKIAGILVPLPGLTNRRNEEMKLCLQG